MSESFFLPDPEERGEAALPRSNVHCMVDLETLATHSRAPIITIGAVLFDPYEQDTAADLWNRAFLRRISLQSTLKHCPEVDPGTIAWWFSQEDAAIKELIGEDVVSLKQGLLAYRQYTHDRRPALDKTFFDGHSGLPNACVLWAKSPDFDCKILENAFDAVGDLNPWSFYQYRCVRTIQDLAWPDGPDTRPVFDCGVKHDARADAVNQAMTVQAAYVKLGLAAPKKDDGVEMESFR